MKDGKVRVVQVMKQMVDHEHGIYAPETTSNYFARQIIGFLPSFPCRTLSGTFPSFGLALSFADVFQNGCVLDFVVPVGLYFCCNTVERVLEGLLRGCVCHSWLQDHGVRGMAISTMRMTNLRRLAFPRLGSTR